MIRRHSSMGDDAQSLEDSMSTYSMAAANLTFKDLIEHVKVIESNYQGLQQFVEMPLENNAKK
jgi:hypothetical protein